MPEKLVLFKASMQSGVLKSIVKACKTTNPVLTIGVGLYDDVPLQFWCRHPAGRVAVSGSVGPDGFTDVTMDEPMAIVVQGKQMEDVLGMMGAKTKVTMEVLEEGQKLSLAFSHIARDAVERVEFEVEEAEETDIPYDEDLEARGVVLEDRAGAVVDLRLLTKFIKSIKPNASGGLGSTNFTLRVEDDLVVVEAKTRDGVDSWRHPAATHTGTDSVLLETKMFYSVVSGAKEIGPSGTIIITDRCVMLDVKNGAVQTRYYLGTAEAMA